MPLLDRELELEEGTAEPLEEERSLVKVVAEETGAPIAAGEAQDRGLLPGRVSRPWDDQLHHSRVPSASQASAT